jgi:hypothetical protein
MGYRRQVCGRRDASVCSARETTPIKWVPVSVPVSDLAPTALTASLFTTCRVVKRLCTA